jgi:hypothetical protein
MLDGGTIAEAAHHKASQILRAEPIACIHIEANLSCKLYRTELVDRDDIPNDRCVMSRAFPSWASYTVLCSPMARDDLLHLPPADNGNRNVERVA